MKKILNSILLLCAAHTTFAQTNNIARPKLVVGIVVDQMRWDYLYRYYARYGNDGFRRILDGGYACQNTTINYIPTYTAPGHSCIYTGSVPAIHGIAANDWIDNATGKSWYCTQDDNVRAVGGSSNAGKMSPRNLLTTTVTDELKLATNMRSRTYGISIKDRGAILPAGHLANGAYWYDDSTGNFMSSSYYGSQLPEWLIQFNNKKWADTLLRRNWNTLYPIGTYTNSISDNNNYEELGKHEQTPTFPHITEKLSYKALRTMPAGNTLCMMLAKKCIVKEELGQNGTTDFLCLSLSSTDYIGHAYAPNSVEAEDTYLRLDKDLASFLHFLDEKVGEGNYLIFISADHGAAHNAAYMNDINIPAGSLTDDVVYKELSAYLKKQFKTDSLVRAVMNYQVVLNNDKIKTSKTDAQLLSKTIVQFCSKYPAVAHVVDMNNSNETPLPQPIQECLINGYNTKRSGSIELVYEPNYYEHGLKGTTHGSWNPYDAHIPLLWYGWHIGKGESFRHNNMTDIAATLSALLHIQTPNGCIGNPIEGVLHSKN